MIYGYVRVSTADQSADGQKSQIARYVVDRHWTVDAWMEVEMSSRRSVEQRRLTELIAAVSGGDTVIVSELSRLGRSIREVLGLIEELIGGKGCRLILIKQGLDLDPGNQHELTNKVLLTVFSMMAELERDFISERTKEGLRARRERGIVLGKPKGVIQRSIYDKDRAKIVHLHGLGVPLKTIIEVHLQYGRYLSLKEYLEKRKHLP
jgi:DNA invertase Pin-like site-specific DNA recombinase